MGEAKNRATIDALVGDAPLVQLDVYLSPRFVQENLT